MTNKTANIWNSSAPCPPAWPYERIPIKTCSTEIDLLYVGLENILFAGMCVSTFHPGNFYKPGKVMGSLNWLQKKKEELMHCYVNVGLFNAQDPNHTASMNSIQYNYGKKKIKKNPKLTALKINTTQKRKKERKEKNRKKKKSNNKIYLYFLK